MTDKESFVQRDASMGDLSRPTYFNYNFQGPFAGRAHLPAFYVGPFLTSLAHSTEEPIHFQFSHFFCTFLAVNKIRTDLSFI